MQAGLNRTSGIRCVAAFAGLALLPFANTVATAAPLTKCRLNLQADYVSPADRSISDETRQEVRQRVLIDVLDDADIVFRGRLASRRYLSDVHQNVSKSQVPMILEVYENVSVLKGRLPQTEKDGRLYLLRVKTCSGGCALSVLPEVTNDERAREQVMLAMRNTLENPSEARDWVTDEVVYRGRIDALNAPCDPYLVNQASALKLITAPEEMERLKRAYPPRTPEEKRADGQWIMKRFGGRLP